jgi:c(7)-type cytochrome triheme protein
LAFLALMLASGTLFPDCVSAVPPGSAVRYEGGDPGRVEFSGSLHYEGGLICIDCHLKIFSIRGHSPEDKINEEDHRPGRLCGVCHDGEKAVGFDDPESCGKCHSGRK